jgi:hypothetical protein
MNYAASPLAQDFAIRHLDIDTAPHDPVQAPQPKIQSPPSTNVD